KEARGLEPLPPPPGHRVRPHDAGPPMTAQRGGELPPAIARDSGRPAHQRIHGEGDRQAPQVHQHAPKVRRAERPPLHGGIEPDHTRMHPCSAAKSEPTIENDEDDESDEERALCDRHDSEKVTAGHLPPPPDGRIFSSATRRLIGLTRESSAPASSPRSCSRPSPWPGASTTRYGPGR